MDKIVDFIQEVVAARRRCRSKMPFDSNECRDGAKKITADLMKRGPDKEDQLCHTIGLLWKKAAEWATDYLKEIE